MLAGRLHSSDRFVGADQDAVSLELQTVSVDVEAFLADADAGLALHRAGRVDDAMPLLEAAEEAYRGDFLVENLYDEWTISLREEARAAYIAVARVLAETNRSEGDYEAAIRYSLRLIARDPYDEEAHMGQILTLLASGRHGDARRAYRRYVALMQEIGVEANPFPAAASG